METSSDNTSIDANVAANFRSLRERLGWSQATLAQRARDGGLDGFHQTTVARVENGQRPLRLSEAIVLSKVLGISVEDLASTSSVPQHLRALSVEIVDAQQRANAAQAEVEIKSADLAGLVVTAFPRMDSESVCFALDGMQALARHPETSELYRRIIKNGLPRITDPAYRQAYTRLLERGASWPDQGPR